VAAAAPGRPVAAARARSIRTGWLFAATANGALQDAPPGGGDAHYPIHSRNEFWPAAGQGMDGEEGGCREAGAHTRGNSSVRALGRMPW